MNPRGHEEHDGNGSLPGLDGLLGFPVSTIGTWGTGISLIPEVGCEFSFKGFPDQTLAQPGDDGIDFLPGCLSHQTGQ